MRAVLQGCFAVFVLCLGAVAPVHAAPAALNGTVTSAREGAMEGVLVSVKKDLSTITTTVVSDNHGHYAFPAERLPAGHYSVAIRAVGYLLDGPKSVDIAAGGGASADIKLAATTDIASQLTNSEWMMSIAGPEAMKKVIYNCTTCHTLERVLRSSHTADDFLHNTLLRMSGYSSQAFPLLPQTRVKAGDITRAFSPQVAEFANFLAANNLSAQKTWSFPFKTLQRPTGKATHVIITEYDLPRPVMQPHDVVLDRQGNTWFSDFGENEIGQLDPVTGKVTEFPYPGTRGAPYADGNLDLEFDKQGNLWVGLMNQTGLAKFDLKTRKFDIFKLPKDQLTDTTQQAMVVPTRSDVDGKVWINNAGDITVTRLDLATRSFEPWISPRFPDGQLHYVYGIYADSHNNAYFLDFGGEAIGRIDAATEKATLFPTPTPASRPRRGRMDDQDKLWFAEWFGNAIGLFDTKTQAFTEWKLPTPYAAPYDVAPDRWGNVWTGGMSDDRISRLDTKTGQITEYLLPRETNMRRAFVDSSGSKPVFWVGNNHHASIIKLEPLD